MNIEKLGLEFHDAFLKKEYFINMANAASAESDKYKKSAEEAHQRAIELSKQIAELRKQVEKKADDTSIVEPAEGGE